MKPEEELLEAAARLRELAGAVPHGPWYWEGLGEKGYPQRISNPGACLIAETYVDPGHVPDEARYIAVMNPSFALAVAGMFQAAAACGCEEGDDHWPERMAAVEAARALLEAERAA